MDNIKVIPFITGIYSQWHISTFVIDGIAYNCCEQYMMAQKALLFDDKISYKKIMATCSPKEQKALGRSVKGFNMKKWTKNRYRIVLEGNMAKFSQNIDLKTKLLATGDNIICEANKNDSIWGVGLSVYDSRVHDPNNWNGLNLLGEALMDVRLKLKE